MKDFAKAAARLGIATEYQSFSGNIKKVSEETVLRILSSMGATTSSPHTTFGPARAGVSTCYLPPRLKIWGWAVQLYAARSHNSWGIGDLADLKELGIWASDAGAGIIMINPLHAANPTKPQEASPYYPSSRVYMNPIYLRIENVPGFKEAGIDELADRARALNSLRLIDRDAIFDLKMQALDRIWALRPADDTLTDYVHRHGKTLLDWATYCVAIERYGPTLQKWPAALRSRSADALSRFQDENKDRIRFHQWVQWLVDRQLEEAGKEIGIVTDLALGVDPAGADAWIWQDIFVDDISIGAPPDEFNASGQNWGVRPMDPWRLASSSFEPFEKTLAASLRHAGGVRIDHVMGLFRQFWIPAETTSEEGTYVRYPSSELLQIVAGESRRNEALVIGEDLGTVEPGVREEMAKRRILSQKVLWFESEPPESWSSSSMASVTTHDLPTIAGVWSGTDQTMQSRLNELSATIGLRSNMPIREVILAVHEHLAKASSSITMATLEDAAEVKERPNLPGTVRPENWALALPVPLEELFERETPADICRILSRR